MATEISEPVRRFVGRHIHSAGQLEILLLLRGAPDREWSVQDVSLVHVATPTIAEQLLDQLVASGFVTRTGTSPQRYRYSPPEPRRAVIDALADAYETRRVAVITLIFSDTR